jgi:CubicO group peptidase (beta-lactamase class C family)
MGEASGLCQAIQENLLSPHTQIDSYLKSLEQSIRFSGSVVVKKGGEEILSRGYGQASESSQNTPDTVFQIMSVSKQFTAAAIFKLLEGVEVKEDRKIDIATEKIINYLPEKFRSEKFKDITFKQLLTHTSGLINNIGDPLDKEQKFEAARESSLSQGKPFEPTPDELISYFIDNPIREEYAGKPHYSNNGYFLLGAIIEHMSGETYGDFIKNHVLPEGMRSTGYYSDKRAKALPKAEGFGFDQENESLKKETSRVAGEAFSAGGLYSTPRDLALWSESLLGGRIITDEHLQLMTTRQDAGDYSCGLEIREIGGKEAIFQGGTLPGGGYKAEMCIFKESQDSVFLVVNNFDVPIEQVRSTLFGLLNNDPDTVKILKPTDPQPPFPGEDKAEFNTKEKIAPHKFLKQGSQFFVIGPNGEKDRLVPLSNGRFLNLRHGVQWEFKEDLAIFHPREGDPIDLPRTSD